MSQRILQNSFAMDDDLPEQDPADNGPTSGGLATVLSALMGFAVHVGIVDQEDMDRATITRHGIGVDAYDPSPTAGGPHFSTKH